MTYIPATYPQTLGRNPADFTGPKPSVFTRALDAFALPVTYVKALDVARYQEVAEVNYQAAYAAGYRLVIIKATEGTNYLDPMFEWHWQHALDAGFYIMLYHFFLGNTSGGNQADWFLSQTVKCRSALLNRTAAWNDIERNPGLPAVPIKTRRSYAQSWYATIKASMSRAGVYSSPALWAELMGNDSIANYGDGWLAHWINAKTPTIPPGWTDAATRIWQTGVYPTYPWVEPVPGVTGTVDVDRWFGNEQSLRDYLGYVDAPPAPVDPLEARVKMLEDIAAKHMIDINGLKVSHNDVVDDLQELNTRLTALTERVKKLETAPPSNVVSAPFKMLARTPARCITHYNDAGKPIFEIYPRDSSETKDRIYLENTVQVFPYPMIGDGARKAYPVYLPAPQQLYVFADDGKLE